MLRSNLFYQYIKSCKWKLTSNTLFLTHAHPHLQRNKNLTTHIIVVRKLPKLLDIKRTSFKSMQGMLGGREKLATRNEQWWCFHWWETIPNGITRYVYNLGPLIWSWTTSRNDAGEHQRPIDLLTLPFVAPFWK